MSLSVETECAAENGNVLSAETEYSASVTALYSAETEAETECGHSTEKLHEQAN